MKEGSPIGGAESWADRIVNYSSRCSVKDRDVEFPLLVKKKKSPFKLLMQHKQSGVYGKASGGARHGSVTCGVNITTPQLVEAPKYQTHFLPCQMSCVASGQARPVTSHVDFIGFFSFYVCLFS